MTSSMCSNECEALATVDEELRVFREKWSTVFAAEESEGEDRQPSVDLLARFAVALADALDRRNDAHLAELVGGECEADQERDDIAAEKDEEKGSRIVGFGCPAGEGPSGECSHECATADHPPEHAAAPSKEVAGRFAEALVDRAQ